MHSLLGNKTILPRVPSALVMRDKNIFQSLIPWLIFSIYVELANTSENTVLCQTKVSTQRTIADQLCYFLCFLDIVLILSEDLQIMSILLDGSSDDCLWEFPSLNDFQGFLHSTMYNGDTKYVTLLS